MAKSDGYRLADRELSWLAFNARVLQEAEDPTVALGDRLDFLAIVSSNLDEFFRVRVASLRTLLRLRRKSVAELGFEPRELLRQIHDAVDAQQTRFGRVLREQLLPELRARGIVLLDERSVDAEQTAWLRTWFEECVRPHISVLPLDAGDPPFLENRGIYLVVETRAADGPLLAVEPATLSLVSVPAALPRFVTLPEAGDQRFVIFLDDVIRLALRALFPGCAVMGAWAVKLTRDAELSLEDEFSSNVVEAIRKAVARRAQGTPSRFLHDPDLPHTVLGRLCTRLGLAAEDRVAGGRYHNLHDLHTFPRFAPDGMKEPPLEPLPALDTEVSILDAVKKRDRLLHFPYQSYRAVLRFFEEAAADPDVEAISVTLYRVARDSAVVAALERAARAGRKVTAFVELKARFDEETNLDCGERLAAAGARVLFSRPRLKVHAKLALVTRKRGGRRSHYALLSTGNFNERTARVYADHTLLTADKRIVRDVRSIFAWLSGEIAEPTTKHLLVAPFALRKGLRRLVRAEMAAAKAGRPCGITLKLNSLEDARSIRLLYDASRAGVPVRLIVRGICRLIPAVPGQSEGITARSIVDRFLEHARIYRFHAGGEELTWLASADWMTRNLDHRVEVAFPIHDAALKAELHECLEVQLADNVKARIIDAEMSNAYAHNAGPPVRAQSAWYDWLRGWKAR